MTHDIFTYDEVFDAAVAVTNSTRADVISRGKTLSICLARMVTIGCLRDLAGRTPSYPEIGRMIGRRHHSTAWHNYMRWKQLGHKEQERFRTLVTNEIYKAKARRIA